MDDKPLEEKKEEVNVIEKVEVVEKKQSSLWVYLLILLVILIVGFYVMYKVGLFKSFIPGTKTAEITPSPTVEITPTPVKPDVSGLVVQVLNGSGVTGEAAKIKDTLIADGFVTVDIGNTTATTEATINAKDTIPEGTLSIVENSIADYKMGTISALTVSNKYDLIIVVGTGKKI